jgi:DNA-directed RNA polymerase subunit H (RpoH/RPB5)
MVDKIYKNCIEMLDARKYNIMYFENQKDTMIYFVKPCYTMGLVIFVDSKITIKIFNNIMLNIKDIKVKHLILIYFNGFTNQVKKLIYDIKDIYIEMFDYKKLSFNITKHELQPKFICLSHEESKNIKKEFGTNLSVIKLNDPISRFYDYKKGSIIKIIRKNRYVTYRMVK